MKTIAGGISQKFKKACRDAGLSEKIHFHALLHSGATWLVTDGAPIFVVQKMLGHSDIQVTMRYSHLVSGEAHDVINKITMSIE